MESVPESRPSEWDKRLSTHSPFRTLGINGQPLPSADGVSSLLQKPVMSPSVLRIRSRRLSIPEQDYYTNNAQCSHLLPDRVILSID